MSSVRIVSFVEDDASFAAGLVPGMSSCRLQKQMHTRTHPRTQTLSHMVNAADKAPGHNQPKRNHSRTTLKLSRTAYLNSGAEVVPLMSDTS